MAGMTANKRLNPDPGVLRQHTSPAHAKTGEHSVQSALRDMGALTASGRLKVYALPFGVNDVTAGVENEFQTAVIGRPADVDLPAAIEQSAFFTQAQQQAMADPAEPRWLDLSRYLRENAGQVWENSTVRLPYRYLNAMARATLHTDLLADKGRPQHGARQDAGRYLFADQGENMVRVPSSYLHKLALADALGSDPQLDGKLRDFGSGLLKHFTNDNTAPEQFSSYIVPLTRRQGMGQAVAKETAQRYLLTQLLTDYANRQFRLDETGQHSLVYFSPHTPLRQKLLGRCLPAPLYRELFMNPCLSGWDAGEKKHRYMHTCHATLTQSRLRAHTHMRAAGIGRHADGAPPSDTSLANNGTHLSLGSHRLTDYFAGHPHGNAQEKALGDMAIKITEYFLPLFVGNYSAAPWRIDVGEFHAENILGFLPHQLADGQLRQFWRQWRKKARHLPNGPTWWDKAKGRALGLKGDYVPDMRLLDYFVALPSTRHALLDGRLGNSADVLRDLEAQGIYDSSMTLYLPYRLRQVAHIGYSGFEGRYYSTFESLTDDLARSAELQLLITALAYRYMATGSGTSSHIADDRNTESDRRQFFFSAAAGIPACYVRRQTLAPFLARILENTRQVRPSNRYPGFLKIPVAEYQRALLRVLRKDAIDLIEMHGLQNTLDDLEQRLMLPQECSTAGRMLGDILSDLNASHPLDVSATEFNQATERYYRERLRVSHLHDALAFLEADALEMDDGRYGTELNPALSRILKGRSALAAIRETRAGLMSGDLDLAGITRLIHLQLAAIQHAALNGSPIL
jgi:hypothetical protein